VNYYLHNSAASLPGLEKTLKWSAWLWELRTGVAMEYAGVTDQRGVIGALVVQVPTVAEWNSITTGNAAAATQQDMWWQYKILLDPTNINTNMATILHELGHVLSRAPHSTDGKDIMYKALHANFFMPLTTNDVKTVSTGISSPWIKEYVPDTKSAVMLPDSDIYVPDMEGFMWYLDYQGVVDGQHTWQSPGWYKNEESDWWLTHVGDDETGQEATGYWYEGGIAHLASVQTRVKDYGGEISFRGDGKWQLTEVHIVGSTEHIPL